MQSSSLHRLGRSLEHVLLGMLGLIASGCGGEVLAPIHADFQASPNVRPATPGFAAADLLPLAGLTIGSEALANGVFSGFTGSFPVPLDPAPGCTAEFIGGQIVGSHACTVGGIAARGQVVGSVLGRRMGVESAVQTGGTSDFGGLYLPSGEVVIFGAVVRLDYFPSITALLAQVAPSTIVAWSSLEGRLHTVVGNWDGPSAFGVTSGSRSTLGFAFVPPAASPSVGRLELRLDDLDTFGGVVLVNSGAYHRYSNTESAIRDGWVRSQVAAWSAGTRLSIALGAQNFYLNQTTYDLRYWGASDTVAFQSTAELVSLQVFDAAGNDISAFVAVQIGEDEYIPTGSPVSVNEVASQLLVSVEAASLPTLGKPLAAILGNTVTAIAKGHDQAACGTLAAFRSLLQAHAGEIPAMHASAWLAQADLIRSILNC